MDTPRPKGNKTGVHGNNPFEPRRYGWLEKTTDRVYLFRNITNSSFVIGDEAVAVIDTQVNPPTARILLEAIRSVTDKPIRFVINTHYHWDHTNGNGLFRKEGARILSSRLTREFMEKRNARQREFLEGRGFQLGENPVSPEETFEGETTLDLGNQPLRLFFAGRAETDDATAVQVLNEKVLMSGDTVMTGSFPIFGQPVWDEGLQGDGEWIRTIERLTALKPDHVIPGHGPLAHEADIRFLIQIERYFEEEVRALVGKGYELERILRDLEPRLPAWITDLPVVWGTPRYAILRVYRGLMRGAGAAEPGWQRFKPSVIPSADAATVETKTAGKEELRDFLQMASEALEGGDSGLQLAILKRATEIFPDNPDALAHYADALVKASRTEASVLEKGDFFEAARACWKKALLLEPRHIPSLLGKGRYLTMMAYRAGDDPREGMTYLEKVRQIEAEGTFRAEAEFYLGMGFRRLGREGRTREQFEKALKMDPTFVPARMALQQGG